MTVITSGVIDKFELWNYSLQLLSEIPTLSPDFQSLFSRIPALYGS